MLRLGETACRAEHPSPAEHEEIIICARTATGAFSLNATLALITSIASSRFWLTDAPLISSASRTLLTDSSGDRSGVTGTMIVLVRWGISAMPSTSTVTIVRMLSEYSSASNHLHLCSGEMCSTPSTAMIALLLSPTCSRAFATSRHVPDFRSRERMLTSLSITSSDKVIDPFALAAVENHARILTSSRSSVSKWLSCFGSLSSR
mmetsp:Transcript_28929/g.74252  ORF Transcript_28929/g.74252 Transcript_28929/m.74252 type:complete len:205 (+) Transcript_28929:3439-4053(+)